MGKYLDFHNQCVSIGEIPNSGLCANFGGESFFELLCPGDLLDEASYWGFDGNDRHIGNDYGGDMFHDVFRLYTPLRQNIVLLMAAINNEL